MVTSINTSLLQTNWKPNWLAGHVSIFTLTSNLTEGPQVCVCVRAHLYVWVCASERVKERKRKREREIYVKQIMIFPATFSISFNRSFYLWTHNTRIWPSVLLLMFIHMSTRFVGRINLCIPDGAQDNRNEDILSAFRKFAS